MKRSAITSVLCVLAVILGIMNVKAQDQKNCGTTDMQAKMWQDHPELFQQQLEYDQQIREEISSATRDEEQVYIIPIVFHVIHNYGQEDISDAQIEDEVRILN